MCSPGRGAQKGKALDDGVRTGFAVGDLLQVTQSGLRNADQRLGGEERLVAGKQHVMAGGEAAEDIVLDHVVGFVFKEQIAFVLINVQPQRANFLVLQGVDGRLRVDQAPRLVLITITPSFI